MSVTRPGLPRATRPLTALGFLAVSGLVLTGCAAPTENGSGSTATPSASASSTAEASAVETMSPARGSVTGGGTITFSGTALSDTEAVLFNGVHGSALNAGEDTVTVELPPAVDFAAGPVTVEVIGAEETVRATEQFEYVVETPRDKQMSYMFAHWENYNEIEWGNLNPVGGDCANFVSQGLIERGWAQDSAWSNTGAGANWTPAWGYVPAMEQYLLAEGERLGLTRLPLEKRGELSIGDIGMFDWDLNGNPDHVMVVSSVDLTGETPKIGFVSHNLDGQYRDLDEAITVEHPGGTAWFWHFTDTTTG